MGVGRQGKTGAHLARWPGPPQPPGSGSLGSGTLGGPGATCSARAVRAEARAQSPPGGDCAPARCDLPPPPLAPWGFGRQGAGAGGIGVHGGPAGANPADRCPGAALWTAPRAARRLCWPPAQPHRMEKVRGHQGDRHGAALCEVLVDRKARSREGDGALRAALF